MSKYCVLITKCKKNHKRLLNSNCDIMYAMFSLHLISGYSRSVTGEVSFVSTFLKGDNWTKFLITM